MLLADCGHFCATEQMQSAENQQQLWYYLLPKRKVHGNMMIIPVNMTPFAFSDRIISIETTFTARKTMRPYVLFLPWFYVGDNPDTPRRTNTGWYRSGAHQISISEVPYQPAFS